MAYQEAIVLFYVSMTFLFGLIAYLLDDKEIRYLIPKILFIVLSFMFAFNGLTTTQEILNQENYTSSPINETVYASISRKFDTSYINLGWSFIVLMVWIIFMIIMKSKDAVLNYLNNLKIKRKR